MAIHVQCLWMLYCRTCKRLWQSISPHEISLFRSQCPFCQAATVEVSRLR